MKLELDENLPESLVATLSELGHDVDSVREEGLAGRLDADIWQAAQDSGRILITQDLDFSDIRTYAPGSHHGLILVRLRLPGRRALASRLLTIFQTLDVESWKRCFVLVSDRKLRIRRQIGQHRPQSNGAGERHISNITMLPLSHQNGGTIRLQMEENGGVLEGLAWR